MDNDDNDNGTLDLFFNCLVNIYQLMIITIVTFTRTEDGFASEDRTHLL